MCPSKIVMANREPLRPLHRKSTMPAPTPLHLVWFKRDLRLTDHKPLTSALMHGPTLLLYIVEPDYWRLPDTSARQFEFARECVADLSEEVNARGGSLTIKVGSVVDVLESILKSHPLTTMWSHEETGNNWTYERDKDVSAWCAKNNVVWHELPQFGVTRGLRDRDQWAARHGNFMEQPTLPAPRRIDTIKMICDHFPTTEQLALKPDPCPLRQTGGRQQALHLLNSFFAGRGRKYTYEMSSPLTAETSCSRLSSHLAQGTVSIREVMRRAQRERQELAEIPPEHRAVELRSVTSFIARLYWHCHFIQKLESEPNIEWRSMHKAFDTARTLTADDNATLHAFAEGQTGFPFVDACMRSLQATGWINFRMRAMLVAFATYHLELDWQAVGNVLARLFTDYEPGIHWSQTQMQSGQTGINTPRIYNPVKQSVDQDPEGVFIRRWVSEVKDLPTAFLHEPWTMTEAEQRMHDVVLGLDYPVRIVDHMATMLLARERLTKIRRGEGFRDTAQQVFQRHGSRKNNRRTQAKAAPTKKAQLSLDI
jgi:deoxyribodipyrimidine photo-lyase